MLDMGMKPYGVGLALAQTVPAPKPHAHGAAVAFGPTEACDQSGRTDDKALSGSSGVPVAQVFNLCVSAAVAQVVNLCASLPQ
jgi:hypothetical protein